MSKKQEIELISESRVKKKIARPNSEDTHASTTTSEFRSFCRRSKSILSVEKKVSETGAKYLLFLETPWLKYCQAILTKKGP